MLKQVQYDLIMKRQDPGLQLSGTTTEREKEFPYGRGLHQAVPAVEERPYASQPLGTPPLLQRNLSREESVSNSPKYKKFTPLLSPVRRAAQTALASVAEEPESVPVGRSVYVKSLVLIDAPLQAFHAHGMEISKCSKPNFPLV